MSSPTFKLNTKLVRAGAGAGKTTNLVKSVLENALIFKEKNGRFPNFIICTFTVKATQELKERLLLEAIQRKDKSLLEYLNSGSKVFITTIHGILSRFLSQYGQHFDLDCKYNIVSDAEELKQLKSFAKTYLDTNSDIEHLLKDYSFHQICEMLIEAFRFFMYKPDADIYSLDDYKESWQDYIQSEIEIFSFAAFNKAIDSYHEKQSKSYASWLEFKNIINESKDLLMLISSSFDAKEIDLLSEKLSLCISRLSKKPSNSSKAPILDEALAKSVGRYWDFIKELNENIKQFGPSVWHEYIDANQYLKNLADEIYPKFLDHKLKASMLTMADLECFSYKILNDMPDLAQQFAKNWDYWYIDEYQDTSPLQEDIIRLLKGSSSSYIVGDPQQSIYLFRGADKKVFDRKLAEAQKMQYESVFLQTNYRSETHCLYFLNDFLSPLGFKPMEIDLRKPHHSNNTAAEFYIYEKPEDFEFNLLSSVFGAIDSGFQLKDICVLARNKKELNDAAFILQKKNLACELASSQSFQTSREILDSVFLLKFIINPFDDQNLIGLLRSPYFYVEPYRIQAWRQIDLKSNSNESSLNFSQPLEQKTAPLWLQILEDLGEKGLDPENELNSVVYLKDLLKLKTEFGISTLFQKAIVERGILDTALLQDSSGKKEANIWKLLSRLKNQEYQADFNISKFLEEQMLSKLQSIDEQDSEGIPALQSNRIQLMSIHKSKGLQFPVVILLAAHKNPNSSNAPSFLLDYEKSKFCFATQNEDSESKKLALPAKRLLSRIKQNESEEHSRLLYVALTRAKTKVCILFEQKFQKDSYASRFSDWPLNEEINIKKNYIYRVYRNINSHMYNYSEILQKNNILSASSLSESILNTTKLQADKAQFLRSSFSKMNKNSRQNFENENHEMHKQYNDIQSKNTIDPSSQNTKMNSLRWMEKSVDGVLLHEIFESLAYREYSETNSNHTSLNFKHSNAHKAISYLRSEALISQFFDSSKVLSDKSKEKDLNVEWGFLFKHNNRIFEGQVDLWCRLDKTVYVLDYKTGSESYKERAFEQLKFYAHAIDRFLMKDYQYKIGVCYPLKEKTYWQDIELSDLRNLQI